jgi:hypothetical protein
MASNQIIQDFCQQRSENVLSGTMPVTRKQYVAVHVRSHKPYSSFLDDIYGTYMLFKHRFSNSSFENTNVRTTTNFMLFKALNFKFWPWDTFFTAPEFERSKIT